MGPIITLLSSSSIKVAVCLKSKTQVFGKEKYKSCPIFFWFPVFSAFPPPLYPVNRLVALLETFLEFVRTTLAVTLKG